MSDGFVLDLTKPREVHLQSLTRKVTEKTKVADGWLRICKGCREMLIHKLTESIVLIKMFESNPTNNLRENHNNFLSDDEQTSKSYHLILQHLSESLMRENRLSGIHGR